MHETCGTRSSHTRNCLSLRRAADFNKRGFLSFRIKTYSSSFGSSVDRSQCRLPLISREEGSRPTDRLSIQFSFVTPPLSFSPSFSFAALKRRRTPESNSKFHFLFVRGPRDAHIESSTLPSDLRCMQCPCKTQLSSGQIGENT